MQRAVLIAQTRTVACSEDVHDVPHEQQNDAPCTRNTHDAQDGDARETKLRHARHATRFESTTEHERCAATRGRGERRQKHDVVTGRGGWGDARTSRNTYEQHPGGDVRGPQEDREKCVEIALGVCSC